MRLSKKLAAVGLLGALAIGAGCTDETSKSYSLSESEPASPVNCRPIFRPESVAYQSKPSKSPLPLAGYYVSKDGDVCSVPLERNLGKATTLCFATGFNVVGEVNVTPSYAKPFNNGWRTASGDYIVQLGIPLYLVRSDGKILTGGSSTLIKNKDGKVIETEITDKCTGENPLNVADVVKFVNEANQASAPLKSIRELRKNSFVNTAELAEYVLRGYLEIRKDDTSDALYMKRLPK